MAQINFFDKIMSLFNRNDPEADKKRMLKAIAKQLNRSKFKFYKTNGNIALPDLAKLFYTIYKLVSPAQASFQNNPNPSVYKNLIIQSQLTETQRKLASQLEEENIFQQAKKMPIKKLKAFAQETLSAYMAEFDTDKIEKIDSMYNKLIYFMEFCKFDYYFLLRKYDPNITERNFTYKPKFESIRGEYIVEDLQNFTSIAWSMPLEDDWTDVFTFLKDYRRLDAIAINQWNKLTRRLIALRDQGIFEMVIQISMEDPRYKTIITSYDEHIIESELEKTKKQVREIIEKIAKKQKLAKTDDLLQQVFGSGVVVMLKHYTQSANVNFSKHNVSHYEHYQPLNYLKAFLIEYFKKDIREFSDLVLIRGKWVSATLASPMSDAYHNLLNISTQISDFDISLSEEEELGTKLKNYCMRADRDKEARKIANNIITDANKKALELLTEAVQDIIEYARNIKALLEDYEKKRPELIINWKELARFADQPIKKQGVSIYKKLYLLISLLKLFLQGN
ncbi:MAG TPA: hypothetical protein VFC68_01690 [Treponemataceae bacterium]|nr:hypothetical protein [Treponemataceae bacterium]